MNKLHLKDTCTKRRADTLFRH